MGAGQALKKTPLYDVHKEYGARIIDFGGWLLPVQYDSIMEEHRAVRQQAGLFDVSHMGEIRIVGEEAESFVNYLITNDVTKLTDGKIAYTVMCYHDGGTIDDFLVYRIDQETYWLVVNAANIEKNFTWIQRQAEDYNVKVVNQSEDFAQLALQGPRAEAILKRLTDYDLSSIRPFEFAMDVPIGQVAALISRTGYTGEDGFEIYCDSSDVEGFWRRIMEAGQEDGLMPAGLGARDTLRFEAGLCLYGHELGPDINPLEARLGFVVKLDKDDFIGKDSLVKAKAEGLSKRLVGLKVLGRGVPRQGYPILNAEDQEVGYVTSGTLSPTLKQSMGLGFVPPALAKPGTQLQILVRQRKLNAEVVKTPFYKREG